MLLNIQSTAKVTRKAKTAHRHIHGSKQELPTCPKFPTNQQKQRPQNCNILESSEILHHNKLKTTTLNSITSKAHNFHAKLVTKSKKLKKERKKNSLEIAQLDSSSAFLT